MSVTERIELTDSEGRPVLSCQSDGDVYFPVTMHVATGGGQHNLRLDREQVTQLADWLSRRSW